MTGMVRTFLERRSLMAAQTDWVFMELLQTPTYWDLATRISKAVYFFLRILHLGDSKEPRFDRLLCYIRRMEQHLVDNADEINLADMDCYETKHMYSFLNRFFASEGSHCHSSIIKRRMTTSML